MSLEICHTQKSVTEPYLSSRPAVETGSLLLQACPFGYLSLRQQGISWEEVFAPSLEVTTVFLILRQKRGHMFIILFVSLKLYFASLSPERSQSRKH